MVYLKHLQVKSSFQWQVYLWEFYIQTEIYDKICLGIVERILEKIENGEYVKVVPTVPYEVNLNYNNFCTML